MKIGRNQFEVIADHMAPWKTHFYVPIWEWYFCFCLGLRAVLRKLCRDEWSHFYLYESVKNGQPLNWQMLQAEPIAQLQISHTHTHKPQRSKVFSRSALFKRYIK